MSEVRFIVTNDADPWFRQNVGPLLWRRSIAVEVGGALSSSTTYVWVVAVVGEDVIGIGALDVTPASCAMLRHAWVDQAWRRRGIGAEIIRRRVLLALETPATRIRVVAAPSIVRLYERAGFEARGTRGQYVVMERFA
jgi:GNAT superfamily N-acetyltransferase